MRTAPYFAAIGFLTIVHALRVIRLRRQHKVSLGDGGNQDLLVAMRVFGNHAEYAPFGLVMLLALEFISAPVWFLHLVGTTLVLGRVMHASALPKTNRKLRVAGMLFTFTSIGLASIGVMLFSLI
jgi:uncharacterized membrane protein YecN with MAPEG domain